MGTFSNRPRLISNGMNNSNTNRSRRVLPYVIEFVKFSTAFAAIVAVALFTLHVAAAAAR